MPSWPDCERSSLFDLEGAILEWRRQMAAGVAAAEALDELESHLRDDVEHRLGAGAGAQEAFESAVARMGRTDLVGREFDKAAGFSAGRERVRRAFLTLAGIPGSYPQTHMNMLTSNPNAEPRWVTYAKAAVFLAPAICLWSFATVFLFPKLQMICQQTGVVLPSFYRVVAYAAGNQLFMVGAFILLFVLLEWRWEGWARYRRASLGGTVFLLNAAVLVFITTMVVFALLAAPALMHQAR